ncbi:MAG: redoxin family protein [Deltaproteobacteria bacterium]|nr:redoxin family protein [Deltaproteobacteria bacterium]
MLRPLLLSALAVGFASSGCVCARDRGVPQGGSRPAPSAVAAAGWKTRVELPPVAERRLPPGFGKARGWLNAKRAPTDAELRGRVVVVDFWTSCCINCMHTLPTLARLEKKRAAEPLLVIGVHTQKFDAEPEVERLRASVIRYGVAHPVAIDGDRGIWEAWGIHAWPTVIVLDAKGRVVFAAGGEPDEQELDAVVESALAEGAAEGSLARDDHGALARDPPAFVGREIDPEGPLSFPEKIAKIPGGFAVADSGHDRLVLLDDAGAVREVIGAGARGFVDGAFDVARFAHPQGVAADGDVLYVADTENHAIRVVDRKAKTVTTLAGTGALGTGRLPDDPRPARATALRSPWDLAIVSGTLYVALAGSHQIATVDRQAATVRAFAGDGHEALKDGPRLEASFAQPSGLASDGKRLFVLDSETSSVRAIDLASGQVRTLLGKGLFVFGDVDGPGPQVRLQHPIGLAFGDGALWVADTYNSKIKRVDPISGETKTIGGGAQQLFEPAGLVWSAGRLWVADTNRDRIVQMDAASGSQKPITLAGLSPPLGVASPSDGGTK